LKVLDSLRNIFKIPELKSRILFTVALLAVYRIGAHIPTPGIDGAALSKFLLERGGAMMGSLKCFGRALSRLTIFALGISRTSAHRLFSSC
jgi:preprotein translocase subunit SecY